MLASGTVVDSKFEIISGLATGGFGVVYQARQLAFDRIVALKLLLSQSEIDKEDVQRFEREARILSSLRHRNLVMFYGFGAYDRSLYIAMELVQGESLEVLLSRTHHLGVEETIRLIKQVCEALICAHGNGVVHRDLKPTNIMLVAVPDGLLVKLIDFGLAKLVTADIHENQKLTEPGSTVGSVEYMSPEQCLGRPADGRSDIYAVGCVLQHCLTGNPPFTADNSIAVMHMHVKDPPPRLGASVKSARARELQFVIDKALAKEVNDRYLDMGELLSDLTTIESGMHRALIADGAPISGPLKGAAKVRREPLSLTKVAITVTGAVLTLALGAAMFQYIVVALRPQPAETSVVWYQQARDIDDAGFVGRDPRLQRRLAQLYTEALDCNRTDGLLDKSKLAHIFARLANVYMLQGQMIQMKHNASQAIALLILDDKFDVSLVNACDNYVMACASLHQEKECLETIKRVVAMWPSGRSHLFNIQCTLEGAYIKAADYSKAEEILRQLEQSPDLSDSGRRKLAELRTHIPGPAPGH